MSPSTKRQRVDVHERFEREEGAAGGSDRSFGLVMGAALAIVGLWPLLHGDRPRGWSLTLAAGFVATALLHPRLLAGLNRAWTWLGLRLHRIVNPIVLGLVFYTTLTPIGVVLRMLGKDVLRLKLDPSAPTYWIPRVPPGPAPDTMRRQF
jgi:hypothetical protein